MKPIVVLVCSALVSAAIALGITALRSSASSPQDTALAARGNDEAAWTRSISELRGEQSQLKKSIEDLRAEMAHRPAVEARVPVGEIEAAVQHALEQKTNAPSSPAVAAVAKAAPKKSFDSQGVLLALTSKDSTSEQRQALWKEVSEAGELDTMVALFEQRAKDDPQSSGAQLDLGRAYLQKIFKVGGGPEAGVWGTKADKAFNAALAIDDHNWDARFAKAVSLSFWPPMLGKQNEAIKNFEVLVEQQTGQAQKPEFAQTYWALGNMYSQSGDKQKALATWQQGLALFPGNAQLEAQIANAQGH